MKTLFYPYHFILLPYVILQVILYSMFYFICYIIAQYKNLCKRDLVLGSSVNCMLKHPRFTTWRWLKKESQIMQLSLSFKYHLDIYFI